MRPQKRGRARKNEKDRFEPTHNYPVGFAKPPAAYQFKKGNPGGPGRPKGSVSHDTMLRRELSQRRDVRIDGRTKKLTTRDLILKTMIKDALAGDKAARRLVFLEAARLFPMESEASRTPSMSELNESDRRSLDELKAMLLDGLDSDRESKSVENDASLGDEA